MNKKIYPIGFFLMLMINVGLIFFIILSPIKSQKHKIRGLMKDHISAEFGFSDEQKARFEQMVKSHREKIEEIEKQERVLINIYFQHITLDKKVISSDSIITQINQLKGQRMKVTYQHLQELKGLCTNKQLEKFDEVLHDIIPGLTDSEKESKDKPPKDGEAK